MVGHTPYPPPNRLDGSMSLTTAPYLYRFFFLHTPLSYYPSHSERLSPSDNSQYLRSRIVLSVGQNAPFALRQLAICPPRMDIFRLSNKASSFLFVILIMLEETLDGSIREDILVINLRLQDILEPFLQWNRLWEMKRLMLSED